MLTLILAIIGALAAFIIIASLRKSEWGINLAPPPACPTCGDAVASQMRKPASLGEALWGGRTCGKCGTRINKWGRAIKAH